MEPQGVSAALKKGRVRARCWGEDKIMIHRLSASAAGAKHHKRGLGACTPKEILAPKLWTLRVFSCPIFFIHMCMTKYVKFDLRDTLPKVYSHLNIDYFLEKVTSRLLVQRARCKVYVQSPDVDHPPCLIMLNWQPGPLP